MEVGQMIVRAWRGYATVEPEAGPALIRFDASVRHYEVLAGPG
jgi:hypothetical protein